MNSREDALRILEHSDTLIEPAQVTAGISQMASDISQQLGDCFPLVLAVMGGATVFTGMLLPLLNFPLEFDYLHLSRYQGTGGGAMQWRVAPQESVRDRTVLVLDDLLDDGATMAAIRDRLLDMGAQAFFCAVLCEKELAVPSKPLVPDFRGFTVPDRHIFGCGMDTQGYWRNLPSIRARR